MGFAESSPMPRGVLLRGSQEFISTVKSQKNVLFYFTIKIKFLDSYRCLHLMREVTRSVGGRECLSITKRILIKQKPFVKI